MANKSESIEERMERKRQEFDQRKTETKKRMEEHRQSIESGNPFGDLSIKVDIDVSDALKGLKALQREAKKTARILREVEESRSFNPVINIKVNSNDEPKVIAEAVKMQAEKLSKEWR